MENNDYTKILDKFNCYIANNPHFSGSTKFNYPKIVEYYLNYLEAFNVRCLNQVGQDVMLKFARFREEQEYSVAYFKLRLSALKAFYTWAYRNKFCNNHLILEYKKSKLNSSILSVDASDEESTSIVYLHPEEQETLLSVVAENEFASIRNKCIVELILASALYAEEIICLPFANLNLKKGYIDIASMNSERRVELNTDTCHQSCTAWLKCRKKALSSNSDCPLLFFTKSFEPLTKRRLYKIVSQYLLKAGIVKKHLGADVLRQTAICNMFRNQKTLEEVQQATGIKTLIRLEKYRLA